MTDDIDRSHHDHENAEAGPHIVELEPDDPHCLWDANDKRNRKDYSHCPQPPIPAGTDFRNSVHHWFQLHYRNLINSDLWQSNQDTPEVIVAALALWIASWQQVPAGSLPDDQRVLVGLAGIKRLVERRNWILAVGQREVFHEERIHTTLGELMPDAERTLSVALSGWSAYADGRLYHNFITERVTENLKNKGDRQRGADVTNEKKRENRDKRSARAQRPPSERSAAYNKKKSKKERESSDRAGAHDHHDASLRSQERKQAPASPAESGSARTERDHRPTSPLTASPRPQPEPQTSNAGFIKEFGMTPNAMAEAMHQAATGSTRMGTNLEGLENIEPIITLIRSNPGLSFRDDVLPAITSVSLRSGAPITSWRYFRDAIVSWHQNRGRGVGNGGKAKVYDPENIPPWWPERDKGGPPPGWGSHLTKPWKQQVIDERTGEPRRYGGRWDWQWLDAVERFQRDGTWHEWFAAELPGRPGSSCPDDICAHFGIVPQARQPNVVVPLVVGKMPLPSRRAYVPPPEVFARQARAMTNGSEELMGDVPSQTAGHSLEGDEAPPF